MSTVLKPGDSKQAGVSSKVEARETACDDVSTGVALGELKQTGSSVDVNEAGQDGNSCVIATAKSWNLSWNGNVF